MLGVFRRSGLSAWLSRPIGTMMKLWHICSVVLTVRAFEVQLVKAGAVDGDEIRILELPLPLRIQTNQIQMGIEIPDEDASDQQFEPMLSLKMLHLIS